MTSADFKTIIFFQYVAPGQDQALEELRKNYIVHYYPVNAPPNLPKYEGLPTPEEFAEADAIFTFIVPSNLTDIKQVPKLKLLQLLSAGYDHVTHTDFFRSVPDSSDLILASASGIHVSTIAEHVLATTMMLFHKLHLIVIKEAEEKKWHSAQKEYGGLFIRELRGMTVGVIGYGHIGRETARLFAAFGSTILALNRSGEPSAETGYIVSGTGDPKGTLPASYYSTESPQSVSDFFSKCDVVVSTLPSSDATRKFVGEEQLEVMKGNSVLVNIGRGDTVDTEALLRALKAEKGDDEEVGQTGTLRIGGASLDVTDPEPLPDDHPLFSLSNTIVTPHCSGLSTTYFVRAVDLLQQNMQRIAAGKGALNAVRGKGETE